jgi:hypothetical protein
VSELRREGSDTAAVVVDRLMAELDGTDAGGQLQVRSAVARTLELYADLFQRTFEAYADLIDGVLRPGGANGVAVALSGAPGDEAAAEVWLHNATDARVAAGALRVTDLTAPGGATIDAALASFSPAALDVAPAASGSSWLAVRIPASAAAGAYHGHVLASDLPGASVPVCLVVG